MPLSLPRDGCCRCGQVRFRISETPFLTIACHCTGCQRLTASAFSLSVAVPRAGFSVLEGETIVGALHGASRYLYCAHCLSWLYTEPAGMEWMVNVRTPMLEDRTGLDPFIEVWTSEKLPWATTPAVHSFAETPPEDAWPALMQAFAARF